MPFAPIEIDSDELGSEHIGKYVGLQSRYRGKVTFTAGVLMSVNHRVPNDNNGLETELTVATTDKPVHDRVWVVAGDKVVVTGTLRQLLERFLTALPADPE